MSNVAEIVHALTEGEIGAEDDFKEYAFPRFVKGDRVRVLTGTYTGEIGTVEGDFHWGDGEMGYWVHLDNSDDESSAITYKAESLEGYHDPLSPGQRVRHIDTGDLGTVMSISGDSTRWIHWDDDGGDPDSRSKHPLYELEPVVNEAMEEYEPEFLNGPVLTYGENHGAVGNRIFVGVFADGRHVGTLQYHLVKGKKEHWSIVFLARGKTHVEIPVSGQEEGGRRVYDDYTGRNPIREAVEGDEAVEPQFSLVPATRDATVYDIFAEVNTDDPEDLERAKTDKRWIGRVHHRVQQGPGPRRGESYWVPMWVPPRAGKEIPQFFKNEEEAAHWYWLHWDEPSLAESAVKDIVARLAEATDDDDDDDDDDWIKDMIHDPILIARSVLEQAGFTVTMAEYQGDSIVIKIQWPIPTASAKVNGWKRAMELLEPIIGKIKGGDFSPRHFYSGPNGETKIMEILIRKRRDEPHLWKVLRKMGDMFHETLWLVIFNGQEVGEFYSTDEGAERLRREMMELHRIMPYNVAGWGDDPGNTYGTGPAIAWWRALRHELPPELRVGEHYLDRNLINAGD